MRGSMLCLFGVTAFLVAGAVPGPWNKEFTDWTAQDAHQVLTDSPWAKARAIPTNQRPEVVYVDPSSGGTSAAAADLGTSPNTTTGPRSATRNPSMAGAPVGAPSAQPSLKVLWGSALPVRLAVLKLQSGANSPSQDQLADAEKEWPNYVVAVVGLEPPDGSSDPKALAPGAFLSVHDAPPLVAGSSGYRRIGESDVYFFRFKKSALPLTETSGEVEFRLNAKGMKISQKFQISAMRYHGRLAL